MCCAGSHETARPGLYLTAKDYARLASWLFWVALVLLCGRSYAQTSTTLSPGQGAVAVPGLWQFHTGDDIRWADPAYDASGWHYIRADVPWAAQGYAGYTGSAWYRKRFRVLPGTASVGVLIPEAVGAYEVYWDGKMLGRSGRLPPNAGWFSHGKAAVFPFTPDPGREGVLSLRFWTPLASTSIEGKSIGLKNSPEVGDLPILQQQLEVTRLHRQYAQLPDIVAAFLMLIAGLLSFAMFLRGSRQAIYLGLTLLLLCNAAYTFALIANHALPYSPDQALMQIFSAGINVGLWLVLLSIFGLHRSKAWRTATHAVSAVYLSAQVIDAITQFWWRFAGTGMVRMDVISLATYGLLEMYPIFLVSFGFARRRSWSTAILGLVAIVYGSYIPLLDLSSLFSLGAAQNVLDWHLQIGDFAFTFLSLLNWLLVVTLVFLVFQSWTRENRRRVLLEQEISSAREVQHVLIPEALIPIPGLTIDSVYKPASEVGGDFFQVIPPSGGQGDGSTLIVVGDVSGKGLKAAMMVALIVGTVRTMADTTRSPAEILAGLNRRLLGRMPGGFVTCLIVRIGADGDASLANAGHLFPFRNGVEWEMPPSLPLGLLADADYEEVSTHLQEGENLMLMTDGVLEAQNRQGELYGFSRISDLMRERPSAERVVETACSFGQEDDITVVSVIWALSSSAA